METNELQEELDILKKKRKSNAEIMDEINRELGFPTEYHPDKIFFLQIGRKEMIKLLLAIRKLKEGAKLGSNEPPATQDN